MDSLHALSQDSKCDETSSPSRGRRWFLVDNRVIDAGFPGLDCNSALRVFLTLSRMANADGICWPTIRRMARRTGCSRGTVSRAITRLIAGGYVVRQEPGLPGRSTRYRVFPFPDSGQPPSAAAEGATGAPAAPMAQGCSAGAAESIPSKKTHIGKSIGSKSKHRPQVSWDIDGGFHLSETLAADLRLEFPQLNLASQLSQAHAWLRANPHRAGKRNWMRFVTHWLLRSVNHGRYVHGSAAGHPSTPARWATRDPRDLALTL